MKTSSMILYALAAAASFVGSLFTSPGPIDVLIGIFVVWAIALLLSGVKHLVLRLIGKTSDIAVDVAWMALVISLLGFGSQIAMS